MTPHTLQFNGINERIVAIIKEGALYMLLNAQLNDTAQKILWTESLHTCESMHNSTEATKN